MKYEEDDIRLSQRLLKLALTQKSSDKNIDYQEALKEYYSNQKVQELTNILASEFELDVIKIMNSNRILLMPTKQESPFAMRLGDIDKRLDTDASRRASTILIMMGIACAFFIDGDEISMQTIRLTKSQLLDSIKNLCQKIADSNNEEPLPKLYKKGYDEILVIDSKPLESTDSNSLSGILNKLLNYLIEEKFIIEERGKPLIYSASEHYLESLREHGIPELYTFARDCAIDLNISKGRNV
ncbi:MAG: Unknown protein [uncultured Sulfurovum sp.]|uniref:Uncharacterized protein n=1 Tax=uncultured Sulfurovum sp. TaxID=269237 RepID=A0A6S6U5C9_9BACT|nr:MAG: Unknown protein [uncultured Sulfurovum sp.]